MNNKKMDIVVVSLFDGLSGGRVALSRTKGLNVLRYYSSEIDRHAMKVADKNYPQDAKYRLGSVIDIDGISIRKEIKEEFPNAKIMLIGGSPCQGFSTAGKMKGSSTKNGIDVVSLEQYLDLKSKKFEFDGQSYLFWEYVRIRNELEPEYFFLENVRITKKWVPMFNQTMGVEPTVINSALVSAQNRVRFYWHNFGEIPQPEDKGILLKDILETNGLIATEKQVEYAKTASYYSEKPKEFKEKDPCVTTTIYKRTFIDKGECDLLEKSSTVSSQCKQVGEATDINGHDHIKSVYDKEGKAPALNSCNGGNREPKVLCGASRGRYIVDGIRQNDKSIAGKSEQILEVRSDEKTNCLTTAEKDNYIVEGLEKGDRTPIKNLDKNPETSSKKASYRKLTPLECERLQTLPENYTDGVSNAQRYKMIGNGWTIDVIAYIFSFINNPYVKEELDEW